MNNTLKFDGKKTYVEVPGLKSPSNDGGAITVEFWNFVEGVHSQRIAFEFKPGYGVRCVAPWGDSLYWDCIHKDYNDHGSISVPYKEYLGKWTHIALVSAGTGCSGGSKDHPCMAIYINGELKRHISSSLSPSKQLKGLVIGAGFDPNLRIAYHHTGMIDGFRVWDHVRTEDEIKRNMHVEMVGDEPGLVACFSFNWGFQDYKGKNWWAEKLTTLPNAVPEAPDGVLKGFKPETGEVWVASGVDIKGAPIGPIYELEYELEDPKGEEAKTSVYFYTAKPAEKEKKIKNGWKDKGIAFYAHRGPTPGTVPLYQLCKKADKENTYYMLTISTAKRLELDPRTEVNQPVAQDAWEDKGEIAYVSASQNGDAVPLFRGYNPKTKSYRYTRKREEIKGDYIWKGIACYVLPSIDKVYQPKPISFNGNGLSEQLWYVLLCRSHKEKWGLSGSTLKTEQIPETGDYTEFQWRLENGLLINRKSKKYLVVSDTGVELVDN